MPRHRVRLLGISLGLAFVALLLPDCAAAAPIHSNAQYLGGISDAITQLVSTRGGLLLQVGWDEFLLFSGFAITLFLIKTALSNRYHGFFDLEGFVLLLGRMAFASIFLTLYTAPLGSSGSLSLNCRPPWRTALRTRSRKECWTRYSNNWLPSEPASRSRVLLTSSTS